MPGKPPTCVGSVTTRVHRDEADLLFRVEVRPGSLGEVYSRYLLVLSDLPDERTKKLVPDLDTRSNQCFQS